MAPSVLVEVVNGHGRGHRPRALLMQLQRQLPLHFLYACAARLQVRFGADAIDCHFSFLFSCNETSFLLALNDIASSQLRSFLTIQRISLTLSDLVGPNLHTYALLAQNKSNSCLGPQKKLPEQLDFPSPSQAGGIAFGGERFRHSLR